MLYIKLVILTNLYYQITILDNSKLLLLTRLNSLLQQTNQRSRIINKIILCSYGTTVSTGKDTPIQRPLVVAVEQINNNPAIAAVPRESNEAFLYRLNRQYKKQLSAYALVKEYYSLIARLLLEAVEGVNEPIYTAINVRLRAEFEISSLGRYQKLYYRFNNLTLALYANISKYSAKFT